MKLLKYVNFLALSVFCYSIQASAISRSDCGGLPSYEKLKAALIEARNQNNGGLNFDMWGTIVDRSGIVCEVAYTGAQNDSQWPGSRVISAQKANTANAFSTSKIAISTANFYSGVQPGGFLYGIQESNPVNVEVAYKGNANKYGTRKDPMTNYRIGGINVFGGGLALFNEKGEAIGGLGVSGDTSCADHNIAWRVRHSLNLDFVPSGVSPSKNDQIIYDITSGKSASGFGHPTCVGKENEVAGTLAPTQAPKK